MRHYAPLHLALTALACGAPRPRDVISSPLVDDAVALPAVSHRGGERRTSVYLSPELSKSFEPGPVPTAPSFRHQAHR